MKMNFLQTLAEKRKLKYGSVTLAFCAVIIALIVVLNVIVTSLADNNEWYIDMTDEGIFTVSEEFVELAGNINQDAKIDIIFCTSEADAKESMETNWYFSYVHSTAEQLARRLDNITVVYKDPVLDHDFFKAQGWTSRASKNNVFIARVNQDGTYGASRYRTISEYFSTDTADTSVLYGYDGEYVFAVDLIRLAYDTQPIVYAVTNHYENIGVGTESFWELFVDAGFDIYPIDLLENIFKCECGRDHSPTYDINEKASDGSYVNQYTKNGKRYYKCSSCEREYLVDEMVYVAREQIPENARMVIINKPTADFAESETDLLEKYLDGEGSVMCFTDPDVKKNEMTNFYGFLESWGGVTINEGMVKDSQSMVLGQPDYFRGVVASSDAASAYIPNLVANSTVRPVFKNSSYLTISPTFEQGFTSGLGERKTQPLFVTSNTAQVNGGEKQSFNVMSVSYSSGIKGGTDEYTSYLVVCTCPNFIVDDYLKAFGQTNADVISSLITQTTAAQTPVDLDTKAFADYSLDISAVDAQTTMLLISIIPALLIIGVMFVVIVRRKHR
ncbi:MAG: Gldg family protein [Clostridia bacterium]|nr:Gldg family protein [Clostridia bacterium]